MFSVRFDHGRFAVLMRVSYMHHFDRVLFKISRVQDEQKEFVQCVYWKYYNINASTFQKNQS